MVIKVASGARAGGPHGNHLHPNWPSVPSDHLGHEGPRGGFRALIRAGQKGRGEKRAGERGSLQSETTGNGAHSDGSAPQYRTRVLVAQEGGTQRNTDRGGEGIFSAVAERGSMSAVFPPIILTPPGPKKRFCCFSLKKFPYLPC